MPGRNGTGCARDGEPQRVRSVPSGRMSGAATLLLAAAFGAAAISKLRSRDAFATTLAALVPGAVARPAARAIPVLELGLAVLLLAAIAPRAAATAALVLLAAFSVALARLARRPVPVPCNCFGSRADAAPVVGLLRNAVLAVAALVVLAAGGDGAPLDAGSGVLALELTVVVGAACLHALLGALLPAAAAPRVRAGGGIA